MTEETENSPQNEGTTPPTIEEAASSISAETHDIVPADEETAKAVEEAGGLENVEIPVTGLQATQGAVSRAWLQGIRATVSQRIDTRHDENAWRQVEEELERSGLLF